MIEFVPESSALVKEPESFGFAGDCALSDFVAGSASLGPGQFGRAGPDSGPGSSETVIGQGPFGSESGHVGLDSGLVLDPEDSQDVASHP